MEWGDGMAILDKLGQVFDNLAIPYEMVKVFQAFAEIWETIPYVLRYVIIGMFSTACLFAILKMLF